MRAGTARNRQAGLTLVELMVALVLGSLLLVGVFNVMLGARASYQLQSGFSQIQASARFALEEMAIDIRNAGFTGCTRDLARITNVLDDPGDYYGNILAGTQAYNANASDWTPSLPKEILDEQAGSDVLTVRTSNAGDVFLRTAMGTTSDDLELTLNSVGAGETVEIGSIVALTDCLSTSVFQVNGVDAATDTARHTAGKNGQSIEPGNSSGNLAKRYEAGAHVIVMETVSYFVRQSSNGTGASLWRRRGSSNSEELLEGVDNLQILMGQDADGDQVVDAYVTPDLAVAEETVAVRLHLLVRSLDELSIDTDTRTFDMGGEVIPAFDDRRLRRVFTKTISVRNRLP